MTPPTYNFSYSAHELPADADESTQASFAEGERGFAQNAQGMRMQEVELHEEVLRMLQCWARLHVGL